ncbi:MAG: hypothetical protein AAGD96_10210 [Chloroflexota bacterium]
MNKNNFHNTLWACRQCDSWYLCQTTERDDTWRMIHLPSADEVPQELWQCQAWKICGADPSACPKCGSVLKLTPAMGENLAKSQSVSFLN